MGVLKKTDGAFKHSFVIFTLKERANIYNF